MLAGLASLAIGVKARVLCLHSKHFYWLRHYSWWPLWLTAGVYIYPAPRSHMWLDAFGRPLWLIIRLLLQLDTLHSCTRTDHHRVLPMVLKMLSCHWTTHPAHLWQLFNKGVQVLLGVRPLKWSATLFCVNPLRDELSQLKILQGPMQARTWPSHL